MNCGCAKRLSVPNRARTAVASVVVAFIRDNGEVIHPLAEPSVTGTRFSDIPPVDLSGEPTAGRVARAYLRDNVQRLLTEDARVRHNEDDSVHQYRVACRRLRSALGTYSDFYDPGCVAAIRERLRALGMVLGGARDAEVMRKRLLKRVAAQDPELVIGPVKVRLRTSLSADYDRALEESIQAMNQPEYSTLIEDLRALVSADPELGRAEAPAWMVLPTLLVKDWKRLRKRVRHAAEPLTGEDHDLALHEVRKGAKRLRYSAESMRQVLGDPADVIAQSAELLQEVLGDRQDGSVARQKVLEQAIQARAAGEDTFIYGRLHAIEDALAHENVEAYQDALAKLNGVRPMGAKPLPLASEPLSEGEAESDSTDPSDDQETASPGPTHEPQVPEAGLVANRPQAQP